MGNVVAFTFLRIFIRQIHNLPIVVVFYDVFVIEKRKKNFMKEKQSSVELGRTLCTPLLLM